MSRRDWASTVTAVLFLLAVVAWIDHIWPAS